MIGAAALLLAACALLAAAVRRPSSNLAVLAGVCLAFAVWQRAGALAAAPLLAIPLLDRRHPFRARAHLAASALLGLGLGLLPWLLGRA